GQRLPRLGRFDVGLHGSVEGSESFFEPALPPQGIAEAQQISRLLFALNGTVEPFDGMIGLFAAERQQAHQVQGVGKAGIYRQRLLAADLGVKVAPRLEVTMTQFAKRGGAPRTSAGSRPLFLAGGPALVT